MKQFLIQNAAMFSIAAFAAFSIVVTALPDDLRDFDWKTYFPKILKALAANVPKHPTPPA